MILHLFYKCISKGLWGCFRDSVGVSNTPADISGTQLYSAGVSRSQGDSEGTTGLSMYSTGVSRTKPVSVGLSEKSAGLSGHSGTQPVLSGYSADSVGSQQNSTGLSGTQRDSAALNES